MTAKQILDELADYGRQLEGSIDKLTPRELNGYWMSQVRKLREQIDAEDSAWDSLAPTVPSNTNATGGLTAMNGAFLPDSEPSALEVALRLIEAGKVAAVPRQAAAFACDLIECIRARQSKEVGK